MKNLLIRMIRILLRCFYLPLETLMTLVDKIVYKIATTFWKTEYVRTGGCANTGQCCRAIGIEAPPLFFRFPILLRFTKFWYFLRMNFQFLGYQKNMLVFECDYLKDNKCSIHAYKPKLCRDFPKTPMIGFTKLHKGCGFGFAKRSGLEFDKVLEQEKHKA